MSDNTYFKYRDHIPTITTEDAQRVYEKDVEYGGSWKRRGGIGAFMMLARKWDRIEEAVEVRGEDGQVAGYHDLLALATNDQRKEGLLDDIVDLRRYLILVEAEVRVRREVAALRHYVSCNDGIPNADLQAIPMTTDLDEARRWAASERTNVWEVEPSGSGKPRMLVRKVRTE